MLMCSLPAPAAQALRVSLDGEWLFCRDPGRTGVAQRWYEESRDRSSWTPVPAPSFWEEYPGAAGYDGWGWFFRTFELPPGHGPLSVHFAGVDDDATVWVNGREVGGHTGYSDPFVLDISAATRPGRNVIVVQVMDHGAGGGIYRPVTVISTQAVGDLLRGPLAGTPARTSAPWVRDAVIYEVYLRSFSPEGTFEALERRLPELRDLGVTVLWLMPIHPVGEKGRKGTLGSPYAVRDYHAVNPEFGTMADFRRLVEATHRLGMKIIIDLVANHTAWDNPLITEHPGWYSRGPGGAIVPPNDDWTDVADLDFAQPGLRRWMADMMLWWVRDVGIDGFRCDVAELVPTDFWESVRGELDRVKPVMMLSEGSLPEHHREAFDITYAWNVYDVLPTLLDGRRPVSILDEILKTESLQFPQGSLRMRFATNHDKNAWDEPAVLRYGPEGLRLATVLVNTLPGVPLIYTGEEVANDRKLSLFEKVEVDWSRPDGMRTLLSTLGALRAAHPALARGRMTRAASSSPRDVYTFLRHEADDLVLVALNFADAPRTVTVTVPGGEIPPGRSTLRLRDVFSDARIEVTSGSGITVAISLGPRGAGVFVPEGR